MKTEMCHIVENLCLTEGNSRVGLIHLIQLHLKIQDVIK